MIDYTSVGKIAGQHGVKGHFKVILEQKIQSLKEGTWIYFIIQSKPVPFFIQEIWGDENTLVVKVKGIDSPEKASEFSSCILGVDKEFLLENQSNELNYLVGFKIVNAVDGNCLGVIDDVFDNSAHLLAQVNYQKTDLLIPIHEELIENFNEKAKEITLQLPEGLLDL
ncbi:MAG: ribosome maturation factor RimM [Bacteroidia bacterium]